MQADAERGFTLIETLIATAVFAFVALAGFESVRQLGAVVTQLAARASSAAAENTAFAQLRSDAASASAVWIPSATCAAPAISMLRRDAGGLSFTTYVLRGTSLLRTTATGPIDPCSGNLIFDTLLTNVASVNVSAIPASALAARSDGALYVAAGIASVAVDAHERDYDGSTILTGNGLVEVTIDAEPAAATADLMAGNRPSGYTLQLAYTCGSRCQANGTAANTGFPELRGLSYTTCTSGAPALPNSSAYYVPSATGVSATGRIVVTQYALHLQYGYTFAGGSSSPVTLVRVGPTFTWPAANNLSDPYPVDYTSNAVAAAGIAALTALAPPSGLGADDDVCNGMNAEVDYAG